MMTKIAVVTILVVGNILVRKLDKFLLVLKHFRVKLWKECKLFVLAVGKLFEFSPSHDKFDFNSQKYFIRTNILLKTVKFQQTTVRKIAGNFAARM